MLFFFRQHQTMVRAVKTPIADNEADKRIKNTVLSESAASDRGHAKKKRKKYYKSLLKNIFLDR